MGGVGGGGGVGGVGGGDGLGEGGRAGGGGGGLDASSQVQGGAPGAPNSRRPVQSHLRPAPQAGPPDAHAAPMASRRDTRLTGCTPPPPLSNCFLALEPDFFLAKCHAACVSPVPMLAPLLHLNLAVCGACSSCFVGAVTTVKHTEISRSVISRVATPDPEGGTKKEC